jgi:general secretion pathway protein H
MTSPSDPPARPRAAGFSLIELVVVLAVLGFALALFVGYKAPWSRGLGLDGAAAELAAGLRSARAQAIGANRAVAFGLDLAGRGYRIGNGPSRVLQGSFGIELLTVAGERQGAASGDIRFNPDGSSTGGRIMLADGRRRVAVGVDWLTGRVRIADVR